jgi:putative colanic acid biosynthesis glycosyltransferase
MELWQKESSNKRNSIFFDHRFEESAMKVLQINTVSGLGSTGSICTDIAFKLLEKGHECFIAYGQGETNYKFSYKIGSKLENHFHNLGSRLFGNQGYYSRNGTKGLIKYITQIKPDIVHLHNLHGNYMNLNVLFDFLKNTELPVVWTLHDCWPFTGKCSHYSSESCYKWQTNCNNCPQIKKYPPSLLFDRSAEMFEDKNRWFNSVSEMTIICVSNWLANEVHKSFLKNHQIVPIYNWINAELFKPIELINYEKYNIPKDKFIILGVSAGWGYRDNKLKDFIKLAKIISDDMQIVLVGKKNKKDGIPKNVIHIPYLNSPEELAEIYSLADVYVHLAVEDTFGKVLAEAMSCGTPVIAYNSTVYPEIVKPGCGYIVETRNIASVADKIIEIKKTGKANYSQNCIKNVRENFDYNKNTEELIDLYKNILAL